MRENAANCEQLKSELERIEQRQRELDAQKGARPKERVVTSSRPESGMEVDEAPRARGRFNLDREAREHMSEGLEVWIPNEATSSLRSLEWIPSLEVSIIGDSKGRSEENNEAARQDELPS